jgi:hypothetical protein
MLMPVAKAIGEKKAAFNRAAFFVAVLVRA